MRRTFTSSHFRTFWNDAAKWTWSHRKWCVFHSQSTHSGRWLRICEMQAIATQHYNIQTNKKTCRGPRTPCSTYIIAFQSRRATKIPHSMALICYLYMSMYYECNLLADSGANATSTHDDNEDDVDDFGRPSISVHPVDVVGGLFRVRQMEMTLRLCILCINAVSI